MSVELTYVETTNQRHPFLNAFSGGPDPRATRRLIEATFHRVVIDGPAGLLTNMDVAAEIAAVTETLGIALSHWSGVFDPVIAARQLAALDHLSDGRLSVRFLLGPDGRSWDGAEPIGSHLDAVRQTDEYLVLLRQLWCNQRPLDHEGPHYSVRHGFVPEKGPRKADIPIRMGGVSGAAIDAAGRHATIFELPSGRVDLRDLMRRAESAAARYGRAGKVGFALPVRLAGYGRPSLAAPAAIEGSATKIGQILLHYASLGISEFMVHGLDDADAILAFARDIAPIFRRTAAIQPARRAASLPLRSNLISF